MLRELRTPTPLLDVRLFRLRGFGAGSLSVTAQFFAAFGFFFVVLQYLQFVVGRSALEAALTLLPLPFLLLPQRPAGPAAGRAVRHQPGRRRRPALDRRRPRRSSRCSACELTRSPSTPGWRCSPSAWGWPARRHHRDHGLAARGKQGVASAVNDLSREFGSALGIAVLGSLLTTSYRGSLAPALAGLPAQVAEGARSSVAFVASDAVDRFGPAGQQLAAAGRQAYVDGVSAAVLTGAVVLVAAAIVVFFRAPQGADEYATAPAEDRAGRLASRLPGGAGRS